MYNVNIVFLWWGCTLVSCSEFITAKWNHSYFSSQITKKPPVSTAGPMITKLIITKALNNKVLSSPGSVSPVVTGNLLSVLKNITQATVQFTNVKYFPFLYLQAELLPRVPHWRLHVPLPLVRPSALCHRIPPLTAKSPSRLSSLLARSQVL